MGEQVHVNKSHLKRRNNLFKLWIIRSIFSQLPLQGYGLCPIIVTFNSRPPYPWPSTYTKVVFIGALLVFLRVYLFIYSIFEADLGSKCQSG
jgi:hypothetical protein